jgi:hypothetical protein
MLEAYNLGKFPEVILAPKSWQPRNTMADYILLPDLMQFRAE